MLSPRYTTFKVLLINLAAVGTPVPTWPGATAEQRKAQARVRILSVWLMDSRLNLARTPMPEPSIRDLLKPTTPLLAQSPANSVARPYTRGKSMQLSLPHRYQEPQLF